MEIGHEYGVGSILRTPEVSGDGTTSEVSWIYSINYLRKLGFNYDWIFAPQVTSPMREPSDIKNGLLMIEVKYIGLDISTSIIGICFLDNNYNLINLQAINYYGISEIIGPGVASEYLEDLDGPTIWEDHFYPEIIDPETGEVLPDGEFGELVITSLTKEATPVIRYRTKDLTRLLPGTAKTMRRIERFTGRSDDMLIIRGVNIFPSQVEEEILKIPALSAQYQIHVHKRHNLDELEVWVEPRVEAISTEVQNSKVALEENIKAWTGVRAKVVIRPPASIERSIGKAIRVIDQREK